MIESTYTLPDGSQFFFIDSGPPKDATNYTTVMILHGSAFNGFSFEKVHKYFLKNNIRSVAWNRRDYRGSSELTDADLEDLRLGRKDFLDGRAVQMAQFLVLFIEKEHIIKVNFEENTGGIALMGWSMGVASVMPFFSDPSLFGEETYNFLEPYIKNLILLDPPASSLGYPEICNQEIYDPWYDPEYQTPEEKFQGFCSWVSTYYDHPNLSINSPTFDELKHSSQDATILKWTAEEFSLFYDEKAAVRSEYHM
ncbi:hypothetical protein BDP27DRAFT_1217333 [Rhodocollybia butyracea]|uniref:AB hydrolase-1 domain-containing protein n=1 Tax=Rhodocollybia butyracea TaxID=206335 RepID=A0A9P5Q0R0_9AGAR|nr:hypothetical protein BDP27DRAFT_1217333 [Rhodocollybia butyracea]